MPDSNASRLGVHGIPWAIMGVKALNPGNATQVLVLFSFLRAAATGRIKQHDVSFSRRSSTIVDVPDGKCQAACKPGSVRPGAARGTGTGRPFLWDAHRCAPRATNPGGGPEKPRIAVARHPAAPIRSCSRWGLPCRRRCRRRGALLPHRFTLARGPRRAGGLFSVALSLGSPPPAVNRHRLSVEPGLSSTRGRAAVVRPPGTAGLIPPPSRLQPRVRRISFDPHPGHP